MEDKSQEPIVQHLNTFAKEVFEGTCNNWEFSHLVQSHANWVVIFANNLITKETGKLTFLTPASPLDKSGQLDKARWLADFEQAVKEWESFQADKKNLLDYLNNIAPDTFNKTICDNWKFTDLSMILTSDQEKFYTLSFINDCDKYSIPFNNVPITNSGSDSINKDLLDILNKFIAEWVDFQPSKKYILNFLNDIAPDTYNEGEHFNWEFTDVTKDGNEYTVYFDNDVYDEDGGNEVERTSDSVTFTTDAIPVTDSETGLKLLTNEAAGSVNLDWVEALNQAIAACEDPSGMYDNEDEGDEEELGEE